MSLNGSVLAVLICLDVRAICVMAEGRLNNKQTERDDGV